MKEHKHVAWHLIENPLLRRILIITMGVTLLFPLVTFYLIFPRFVGYLTIRTEETAIRVSQHVHHNIFKNNKAVDISLTPDVIAGLFKLKKDFQLEKLQIFSSLGETLFSTDPKDLGKLNTHTYFKDRVAQGEIVTNLVEKDCITLEGRKVSIDVVETYTPFYQKGIFAGAVEIYYDITEHKNSLTLLLNRLKHAIVLFSVFMLVVIIATLLKASRHMLERTQAESALQNAHALLEKKVIERTSDLEKANQILQLEVEERRAAESTLQEKEDRYRSLVQSSADAIISIDESQRIIQWNQAATAIFGYSPESALGKPVTILIPEYFMPDHKSGINDFLSDRPSSILDRAVEIEGRTDTGHQVPIELTLSSFKQNKEQVITAIIRDISLRKETDFKLKCSHDIQTAVNQLLKNSLKKTEISKILDQTLDILLSLPWLSFESMGGIFLVKQEPNLLELKTHRGFSDEQIKACQTIAFGKCLCGQAALTGKVIFADHVNHDHTISTPGIQDHGHYCIPIRARNQTLGVITIYLKKNHQPNELEKIFLTTIANTLAGILIHRYSEAEKEQIHYQLVQSQKIESLGTLAGGIAHDFNNILSAIIGYTELTLEDVPHPSEQEQNLQAVLTAGMRARELVKQILTFARQVKEEIKPLRVDAIAKEALKLLRSTLPTTIDLQQQILSKGMIMGDATQIHQIFMNLCTNAAHAMGSQVGRLTLRVKDVHIHDNSLESPGAFPPGDYIEITIEDTGHGIPPGIMSSIFEPYFTTKKKGEGTGMGLAVVHGIVKNHHGEISVKSHPGEGTVFTIHLPAQRKAETCLTPRLEADLPMGTEHLLFVDDELPIAKINSLILKRLGYKVTIRTSSIEALTLFKAKPKRFDLVITDITMPNLSGTQLAVELIKIRADIPIIICSGYQHKFAEQPLHAMGIKAFLGKPVLKKDLAETIRKVLDELKKDL